MLKDAQIVAYLKDLRRELGISQADLAEAMGIDPKSTRQNKHTALKRIYTRIEKAGVLGLLQRFATAFNVPVESILQGEKGDDATNQEPDLFRQVTTLSVPEMEELHTVLTILLKREQAPQSTTHHRSEPNFHSGRKNLGARHVCTLE